MEAAAFIGWIALLIAQVIYWDAARNKIGRRKGDKGFLNMPAGGWAVLSCWGSVMGPITWVLYLVKRKKLIAKAGEYPVNLSTAHRIFIHILLIVVPVGCSILTSPRF